jgi:hypothetical protein
MRRAIYLAASLASFGCAGGTIRTEPNPVDYLTMASEALARHQPAAALRHLRILIDEAPGGDLERRARVLGAAVALDPRNPDRDPDLAAGLAAGYRPTGDDDWGAGIARTLFVLALDYGANPGPELLNDAPLAPLPALTTSATVLRLQALERELERIRRTLEPD